MSETDELQRCLRKARAVISEGVSHWNATGFGRRRKEEHEELINCGFTIREMHNAGELDQEEYEKRRGEIEVAKLVVAAADLDAEQSDGSLAAQYPTDVLNRMIKVDEFRQYDIYEADDEELQQRIQSHDSKLYDLVQKEIAPQLRALNEALTGTHSELSRFQMRGLKAIYGDRLDTLHEATALYIRYHGLPNVVDDMEEAILEASDAANDREAIVTELEASIEETIDDLSMALHQSIRDEYRQLETELYRLNHQDSEQTINQRELSSLIDRLELLLDQQAEQQSTLAEQIDLRESKLTNLNQHIEQLEQRLATNNIEERVEQLVNDELDQLREERDRLSQQITTLETERAELESIREELENNRTTLKQGNLPERDVETIDPVLATEARINEFDYSSRFEQAVHDAAYIALPDDDEFSAEEGYWRNHHYRNDDRVRMRRLLEEHADPDGESDIDSLLGQYPLNRRSRFVVEKSGLLPLTGSQELTIEFRMQAHLETFAQYGADDRPATRSDLLKIINDVIRDAEQEDVPSIVAIASPTGWSDAVETTIENGDDIGISFSRQVEIVLVDLNERSIIYDETQPLVAENIELFEFRTLSEEVQDCETDIQTRYINDNRKYLKLSTVVEEMNYSEQVVMKTFARLENQGVGAIRQTAYGTVLDLRNEE